MGNRQARSERSNRQPRTAHFLLWDTVAVAELATWERPTDPLLADALWGATAVALRAEELGRMETGRTCIPWRGHQHAAVPPGAPGDDNRCQFYEHIGNAAVSRRDWKLVRKYPGDWELYKITDDATELTDVAAENPALVRELAREWATWSARCGVVPRERILELTRWGIAASY